MDTTVSRDRATPGISQIPTLVQVYTPSAPGAPPAERPLGLGPTAVGRRPTSPSRIVVRDDPFVSRHHLDIHVSMGGRIVEVRDRESSHGTFVNGRRVARAILEDRDLLRVGDTFLIFRRLPLECPDVAVAELLGCSPEMRRLRAELALVASEEIPLLLLGPSGVGKTAVAHAVHQLSDRSAAPFVKVNCAALPEGLAERELFGHVKGAFTGASEGATGLFMAADRGTLFLDEIGDLPGPVQAKVLTALEDRIITPLGTTRGSPSDFRLVAATDQDLGGAVARGDFRSALYARIFQYTLELPPLRHRREDLLLLLEAPLKGRLRDLEPDLIEALLLHTWPWNVREVFPRVATVLELKGRQQDRLGLELVAHLLNPEEATARRSAPAAAPPPQAPQADSSQEEGAGPTEPGPTSREELLALVDVHGGNVSRMARATGYSRRQIYRWLKRWEVDVAEHREDG